MDGMAEGGESPLVDCVSVFLVGFLSVGVDTAGATFDVLCDPDPVLDCAGPSLFFVFDIFELVALLDVIVADRSRSATDEPVSARAPPVLDFLMKKSVSFLLGRVSTMFLRVILTMSNDEGRVEGEHPARLSDRLKIKSLVT